MSTWMTKYPTAPKKEEFYSNLNMEDITYPDYMRAKRVENKIFRLIS